MGQETGGDRELILLELELARLLALALLFKYAVKDGLVLWQEVLVVAIVWVVVEYVAMGR